MKKQPTFLYLLPSTICALGLCLMTCGVSAQLLTPYASYDFDGNALDSSANGFNGTINSATAATDRFGDPSKAMSFIGGATISLPIDFTPVQNFTMSVWLQRQQDFYSYVVFNDGWFKGFGLAWGWPDGKTGPFFFAGNGDWHGTDTAPYVVPSGGWVHVVGTVTSSGMISQYVNGALVGTGNTMGSPIAWVPGNPTVVSYSATTYGNSSATEVGRIDDLQFYNKALSSTEVTTLYNTQSVPEPSTYALLLLSGAASLWALKRRKLSKHLNLMKKTPVLPALVLGFLLLLTNYNQAQTPQLSPQSIYVTAGNSGIFAIQTGTTNLNNVYPQASVLDGVPFSLAFDSNNNLFIGNGGNDTIAYIPHGATNASNITPSGVWFPLGMAYANNNIYIANYNAGTLQSMSTLTYTTTTISGGMYGISGVAVDANGNIFVANYNNNTISKIDNGSTTPVVISMSNLNRPVQINFDQTGNLFIANGNGTISTIPSGSTDVFEFLSFGTNAIGGVGIDITGNMFFTQDSSIYQVPSNTTTPILYSTGSVPLGAIAFETVPEPSTYALLLLSGVASLWVLKRRKS